MMWRERNDLWNGVVQIRHETYTNIPPGFVAFFVEAPSRDEASRKLFVELLDRGWSLLSFLNLQVASAIDDEAAEHLAPMAIAAEAQGISFSEFPALPTTVQ